MNKEVWLSRRALRLHVVILVVVPAFMALCLWQLSRALGGNELSWAYVFEWPLFAAYAVYMWWRFVHEAPEGAAPTGDVTGGEPTSNGDPAAAARQAAESERRASEDAELAAYNDYLGQLAQRDQAARRDPGRSQAEKHIS
jgi:hypothetical protein